MSAPAAWIARSLAVPSSSVLPVRKTAASDCMARCISMRSFEVGVEPVAWRKRSKRDRWPSVVEAGASGTFEALSTTSPQRRPAARPKTTRSVRLLEPRRLAPCTETQAASPTAIRPGTTVSALSPTLVRTSP